MAAVGLRALAMMLGAGYGGSYLYNNMDAARGLAARILLQHQAAEKAAAGSGNAPAPTQTAALSAQMDALTREMARARDPVVVVGPANSSLKGSLATLSDVFNLLGWAVFAVSVGGVSYYVAVRKNVSLRDLAWVSQSTFNGTISAMQKGITRVSGAVGAVRRDLGERLKLMEGRVEKVRASLSDKIEEEVAGVKSGIGEVGSEVSDVKVVLDDVNSRIEQLDTKIDTATTGIMALARVVSSLAPERLQPGNPFYDLKRFADAKQTPELGQPALRQRLSNGGLRSLLGGTSAPSVSTDSFVEGEQEANGNSGVNRGMNGVGKGKSKPNGTWNKRESSQDEPLPWEC